MTYCTFNTKELFLTLLVYRFLVINQNIRQSMFEYLFPCSHSSKHVTWAHKITSDVWKLRGSQKSWLGFILWGPRAVHPVVFSTVIVYSPNHTHVLHICKTSLSNLVLSGGRYFCCSSWCDVLFCVTRESAAFDSTGIQPGRRVRCVRVHITP